MQRDNRLSLVRSLADAELRLYRPKTQEDCCAISARIDVTLYGKTENDLEVIKRGAAIAEGLFGEAYTKASEAQRIAWIDMCEQELRHAMNEFAE